MHKSVATIVVVIFLNCTGSLGQRIYNFYNPGDWVSYTNTRYITSIARGFNTVYFGTTGGILRYDIIREKWLDPLTVSDGMPENRVRRLAVDKLTDEIWVETPRSTSYYNRTFQEWRDNEPFPADKIQQSNISVSDLPQLFTTMGYNYFSQGYLVDKNLMQYPITQMLRDEPDIAWMGIWGLGAAKGDLRRDDLQLLRFGLFDADVTKLDRDGDEFWFLGGSAGMPGTITHYNRSEDSWEYFEPEREAGIISDQFYTLTHDDKYIWIGTELGLVRLDKDSKRFKSYSHFDGIYGTQVLALLPITGNLMIGTDEGVSIFDFAHDSIYAATSPNMKGRAIHAFALHDRTIYAGTQDGLFSLNWGGSNWQKESFGATNLNGAVNDLKVVDSLLYIAGDDGVIVVNLNDEGSKIYDRNTKFHNADLSVLLVYQGVIWVGGSDGLFKLNRSGNWYRYSVSDGLIGGRITSLVADGDYIWIGTDKGATRFYWKSFDRQDWLE